MDAHEVRDVGICNIPGAFISADMDKDTKMALHGRLSELMVNIAPQIYRHHVIYEKVRLVLYINLNKAIYGCPISALMLYERLVAYMRDKGFELNPYETCTANKIIGFKKMEVCWHVDDLKVSHMYPEEATKFMEWIVGIYGDLRITRGKVQK